MVAAHDCQQFSASNVPFYFRKKAAINLFLNQSFFRQMFWKIEVTAETDF